MDPSTLSAVIVSAFFISFATVIVPSPGTIAASRYAVTEGTRAAAACLSGVVFLDILVFLGLALGLQPLLERLGGSHYFPLIGGFFLVLAGGAMIVLAPKNVDRMVTQRGHVFARQKQDLHGPFAAGFLIPLANPGYWIWWTTIGTALIHAARHWGRMGLTLLLAGYLTGVLAWYIPLLWALRRGREVFSPAAQRRLLVILGAVMVGFGGFLLFRSFHGAL